MIAELANASAPPETPRPLVTLVGAHGSDPRSGGKRTLPQLLLAQARKHGAGPFLRYKRHGIWRTVSWSAFVEDVKTVAHALRRRGVKAGDVVAVISENLPELFVIQYAVQCLGAAVSCLYPDEGKEQLGFVLQHSGAVVLVAEDQEQVDKALEIGEAAASVRAIVYLEKRGLWEYEDPRLLDYEALRQGGRAPTADEVGALQRSIDSATDETLAALCYTSGTTGRPKGVALTHRYLTDNAYRLMASLKIPPGIRYLSYISPAWATEQILGVAMGVLAPMVVHFAEMASTVQADLREIGVQFLMLTPPQWEAIESDRAAAMLDAAPWRRRLVDWALGVGQRARVEGGRRGLGFWLADRLVLRGTCDNLGLKQVVVAMSGGSGMAPEVFRRFHAMGVALRNLYGYTEYGVLAAHCGATPDPRTLGTLLQTDPAIGEPLQLQLDESGQVRVRGGSGVSTYYRNPEATAADRDGPWHRSGDVMRLDPNGELVFIDRVKHLRRLRDGRAYPREYIENQLRASPFIRYAIAIGDATRPSVVMLVNIDEENVGRFAEAKGIAWRTLVDLSQHPAVQELIRTTIADLNSQLDAHARVTGFAILPKHLDSDDGELTRSRKPQREPIEERYAPLIEAIYEGAGERELDIRVRYNDATVGNMRQAVKITKVG